MSTIEPTPEVPAQPQTANQPAPFAAAHLAPQQSFRPMVQPEFKSIGTMWLLWFFLGGVSAHEFYLGRTGIAFLRLFTGQYLLVGLIIDLFTNTARVRNYNDQVSLLTGVASPTAVIVKA
ncbi:TM2 domain-containing protein [Kineococcus sp. DHX-1]|uniref:TM2 domain-containing protein n=1 Tax=Kineococcus sp. DHX-1 TaxID=3349638 RepID=UPI0036D2796D